MDHGCVVDSSCHATVTVFNINLTDDFLFLKLIVDLINQYEDFVC